MKLALSALLLIAAQALAHNYDRGDIQVRHPWSRATPPGAKVAVAYMEIRNHGRQADKLLSAATPVAKRVEMHITQHEGEVARMRQLAAFEIPPRERYELRVGGSHLMLVDLVRPLKKGERFAMTLRFERAGEVEIEVEVQEQGARRAHH